MPASWAVSMIACASDSAVSAPKFIVPRQSRLTVRPVRPRWVNRIKATLVGPGIRCPTEEFARFDNLDFSIMELRQLEHFVAVAEARHFTKAAEVKLIPQSGLSASIRA